MESCYGLIVMPIYNDWESCRQLIESLDKVLSQSEQKNFRVLIIDDGSTDAPEPLDLTSDLQYIRQIDVLPLQRNLGHQRAICVALSYVQANIDCEAIILMDSDGEDDPEDVPRLLERFEMEERKSIVFARRTKRSEYWLFRVFLQLYKITHRLLTGKGIYIGNFSVIPYRILAPLVTVPELWSHYAAAVMHARLPYVLVPTARAKRLDGSSHMSFTRLVLHGLSAISVYSETIGIRLLIASGTVIALILLGFSGVGFTASFTDQLIPRWTAIFAGLSIIVMLQIVMIATSFSFLILSGRKNAGFIPARDYHYFTGDLFSLWTNDRFHTNT